MFSAKISSDRPVSEAVEDVLDKKKKTQADSIKSPIKFPDMVILPLCETQQQSRKPNTSES